MFQFLMEPFLIAWNIIWSFVVVGSRDVMLSPFFMSTMDVVAADWNTAKKGAEKSASGPSRLQVQISEGCHNYIVNYW